MSAQSKVSSKQSRIAWKSAQQHICFTSILPFLIVCIIQVQNLTAADEKTALQNENYGEMSMNALWVITERGLMAWGLQTSAGICVKTHHRFLFTIDAAPLGLIDRTDAETQGLSTLLGGSLSYLFQINLFKGSFSISPGITSSVSTVPYIYGTFNFDGYNYLNQNHKKRQTVFSTGPELRLEFGKGNGRFCITDRVLFSRYGLDSFYQTMGFLLRT